jgi:spermidine synthase
MELSIGILALGSPFAFEILDSLYGLAYRVAHDHFILLLVIRFLLVSLIILPPTFLMGGTLPLFCRQYVNNETRIARSIGFLYGLNTIGAAFGCAATGFFLLPSIGMFSAICIGVLLNFMVALATGFLGLRASVPALTPEKKFQPSKVRKNATVSTLLFLIGFVALGNEVLWARHLALIIQNTVYTYTLTLTAVLVGIVLGSAVAAIFFDRSKSRAFWLGALQVAIGFVTLGLMLIPAEVFEYFEPLPLSTYFFVLLPSAVLSGAAFPLGVRMVVEDPAFAGIGVGRLSALNILGGIAGSLAVGFVVLPTFGQQSTLLFTTGLSLLGGFVVWIVLDRRFSLAIRWSAICASLTLWFGLPLVTGTNLPSDFLTIGKSGDLVGYYEGLSSNLAVFQKPKKRVLEINRLWQGQDKKNHQIMAAHVPMLLRSDPRSVLVVGAGTGNTAKRFLMYSIDRLDVVDIEPAVFDVIKKHFDSKWMNDDRVRLLREDGRNFLAHSGELYDVISIEVGQIIRPGVPYFYTSEFYELARERLEPGGFFSQFIPIPYFSVEKFRSAVATFLNTFPQSFLWYNREEMILIGVKTDRLSIKGERLVLLEADPAGDNEVRHDLRISLVGGYSMHQLPVFLGSFIAGPNGLRSLTAGAPLFLDDKPVLEYAVTKVSKKDVNEIAIVALLRKHLDPVEHLINITPENADPTKIEQVRENNLSQIVSTALHRRSMELLKEQNR